MGIQLVDAISALEVLKVRGKVVSEQQKKNLNEIIEMLTRMHEKAEKRDRENADIVKRGLSPIGEGRNNAIEKLLNFVSATWMNMPKMYETAKEDYERTSGIVQDILHELEFLPNADFEALGRELSAVRRHRREAENYAELVEPIVKVIDRYPNLSGELRKAQSEFNKIRDKQSNRKYTPRELTGLALAFQMAGNVKFGKENDAEPKVSDEVEEKRGRKERQIVKPRKGFTKRGHIRSVVKRRANR